MVMAPRAIVFAAACGVWLSGSAIAAEHGQSSAEANAGEHAVHGGTPVGSLTTEHDLIGQVVEATAKEATAIRETGQVDTQRVGLMVSFFKNFADTCHHAKEERYMFPALRDHGADDAVINRAIGEHQQGRYHLGAVESLLIQPDGMSREEARAIASHLGEYAAMMKDHIELENTQIWPSARKVLPAEEMAKLMKAFVVLEHVELGEDFHPKYLGVARQLTGASQPHDEAAGANDQAGQ